MAESARPVHWTDAVTAAAVLLLGVLLSASGAGILHQWQQSFMQHEELHPEDLLGAASAAVGAVLVGWWFLSLIFAGASTVLDRMGKTRAAAASRRLSPAFMQRLVLAALSVQLVSGPAANADELRSGPEWTPTQDQLSAAPAHPGNNMTNGVVLPLLGDDSENNPVSPPPVQPGWQPAAPVASPGLLVVPPVRAVEGTNAASGAVTVLAGDSLWDIAAQAMGPGASDVEIAMQWPRWYEANKATIGQNPDVLLPGQILQPPPAA